MKHLLIAAVWCATLSQVATTPKPQPAPPPPPSIPTLSATEQIAIASVSRDQQTNQQEAQVLQQRAAAIIADIARSHPGYHLGTDGKLAPDAKPEPPPPASAPRPTPPAQ